MPCRTRSGRSREAKLPRAPSLSRRRRTTWPRPWPLWRCTACCPTSAWSRSCGTRPRARTRASTTTAAGTSASWWTPSAAWSSTATAPPWSTAAAVRTTSSPKGGSRGSASPRTSASARAEPRGQRQAAEGSRASSRVWFLLGEVQAAAKVASAQPQGGRQQMLGSPWRTATPRALTTTWLPRSETRPARGSAPCCGKACTGPSSAPT
mmetsp:Transcript_9497/g.16153  ORF Transcript_9497/g.16153 Transcript_9497/m.16153 type:complete len:208 (+) Transcript_9497:612-1235(+)